MEQRGLVGRAQQRRGEACGVERRPEAIAGAGEVVSGGGRVASWIDPAKQDAEARRNDVRHVPAEHGVALIRCRLHRLLTGDQEDFHQEN